MPAPLVAFRPDGCHDAVPTLPRAADLVNRLTVKALSLALDEVRSDEGARVLVELAESNRSAVHLALRRMRTDDHRPESVVGRRAADMLRHALELGDWDW